MATFEYPVPRRDRSAAQRQREAAFARIGRVRGWTIVGAGALTAAAAAAVSAAVPGHTLGAKTANPAVAKVSSGRAAVSLRMPPLATPSQLGLRGPAGAPTAPSQPQAAPQPQPQAAPQPQPQAAPQPQPQPAPAAVSGGS